MGRRPSFTLLLLLLLALLLNQANLVNAGGTLIVTTNDVNLKPTKWDVHTTASRSWSDSIQVLHWNVLESIGFLNFNWYSTYEPTLVIGEEKMQTQQQTSVNAADEGTTTATTVTTTKPIYSYKFETHYGFLQRWLGAEIDSNQLHFVYEDQDGTASAAAENTLTVDGVTTMESVPTTAASTYSGSAQIILATLSATDEIQNNNFATGIHCWTTTPTPEAVLMAREENEEPVGFATAAVNEGELGIGIGVNGVDGEDNLSSSLQCDNPSVSWDNEGTTTISVSMLPTSL